jgi:hypothetical protein
MKSHLSFHPDCGVSGSAVWMAQTERKEARLKFLIGSGENIDANFAKKL